MDKICAIFNIAPLYRRAIYSLMKQELDIEIYSGDSSSEGIAIMPTDGELHNVYRGRKLVWQKGALRLAFRRAYDVYILTGNAGILSNWFVAVVARLRGRRVYLWSHGLKGGEGLVERWKNMLYFRLAGNALLYGERAQELLAQRGFRNTTVVYNSLDYDTQFKLRDKIGDRGFLRNYFGNDLPTVCYLGRLTPFKKVDILIEAMAELECNLIIVGGGSEESKLKELTEKLELTDRVWFYGESYDEQFIATVIANSQATVNPSSIGLTVIHSLMFGTPVVTHDNWMEQMPEAEVIIPCVTGFLFRQGDSVDFVRAVRQALRTPKNVDDCYSQIDQKYNPHNQIQILKTLFKINN